MMLASFGLLTPVLRLKYGKNRRLASSTLPQNEFIVVKQSPEMNAKVTIISSVYCAGDDLEPFLANLSDLELFHLCEVVLILVCPSQDDLSIASRWSRVNRNTSVYQSTQRITVYEAWNFAIKHSSAPLITNANVDDRKEPNLISRQIEFMSERQDVSVAYTDYEIRYPTGCEFDEDLQMVGTQKQTLRDLVIKSANFSHAAPIWRREAHALVGGFRENFESSGDTEFWVRCLLAGLVLERIPGNPGYLYFWNPDGLSTKRNSLGKFEWGQVMQENAWAIIRHLITGPRGARGPGNERT
jgi:hypothetical protein